MATAQDIIKIMQDWIGTDKRKIIDLYNSHKPLAQGYAVKYTDAWCDTTVSAAFIKADAVDLIGGTECGVERHINLFKTAGIWEEDGNVIPEPGWIICYNWDDSTQPNDGFADHIGIVEKVEGNSITVIEGNYNDAVRRRVIPVGWGYIRGYALPKYADGSTPAPAPEEPAIARETLSGIDIASYQSSINTETIQADFIIVKSTQGTSYVNPYFKKQIDGVISSGKIPGIYHYATGAGVTAEVEHFLKTIKDYIGKAFLCLDWETSNNASGKNTAFNNPRYALSFMNEVKARTGATMFIYGSKYMFKSMDWSAVVTAGYPLWGAQYKNYNVVTGHDKNPWQSDEDWGAFGDNVAIHQYTSSLVLPGYVGNLDGDICYLSREQLLAYTKADKVKDTTISYRAHVQKNGWMPEVKDGEWAGTTGEAKRLEALIIDPPEGVVLDVDVHIQKKGWVSFENIRHGNDRILGTTGKALRLEAVRIRCRENTTGKKLAYQVHCQTYGDMPPCSEGEVAGTTGLGKRMEAIRICLI